MARTVALTSRSRTNRTYDSERYLSVHEGRSGADGATKPPRARNIWPAWLSRCEQAPRNHGGARLPRPPASRRLAQTTIGSTVGRDASASWRCRRRRARPALSATRPAARSTTAQDQGHHQLGDQAHGHLSRPCSNDPGDAPTAIRSRVSWTT